MTMGFALDTDLFNKNIIGCNEGNAKACYNAGKIYSAEAYKARDYNSTEAASKVAAFYKKSCEMGYAAGCTAYGMSYAADKNKEAEKDARYYLQKGCDGGDLAGCNILRMAPQEK